MCNCGSTSDKTLGWEILERVLQNAAEIESISWISFTGGEPFLEIEKLVSAVRLCSKLSLNVAVVTNAFWAVNRNATKRILKSLKGLHSVGVSADMFHQEFVPLNRVRHVVETCNEVGIKCSLYQSFLQDVRENEAILAELVDIQDKYDLQSQPVRHFGRARTEINDYLLFSSKPGICTGSDNPMIAANGDVFACCGPSVLFPGDHLLRLGNIYTESLQRITTRAEVDPIIHTLRLYGPVQLLKFVQVQAEREGHPIDIAPDFFGDTCLLCEYILADEFRAAMIKRLFEDPKSWHEIAVARFIEFGEVTMLSRKREWERDAAQSRCAP